MAAQATGRSSRASSQYSPGLEVSHTLGGVGRNRSTRLRKKLCSHGSASIRNVRSRSGAGLGLFGVALGTDTICACASGRVEGLYLSKQPWCGDAMKFKMTHCAFFLLAFSLISAA